MSRGPLPALAVGVLALLAWAAFALFDLSAALQGWWTAFVFASGVPLGALAWLLIRRLVGGDWGEAFAPELEPAARAAPLLVLLVLPGLIGAPWVFRWAAEPAAVEAQVRHAWLNGVSVGVRDVALLVALAAFAWRLPRIEGPRGRLLAGLGLVVYGVAVTLFAVDWVLDVQPNYTSSAAGMELATQQLAAALAFAGLQGAARPAKYPAGDLAALLFACLVGLIYLGFMSYLVVWYGDRPDPDRWYVLRTFTPWRFAVWVALIAGFVAPAALLAFRRGLGTRRALRWASASALCGLGALVVWQVGATMAPLAL
ncbi:MAG: hypothetical protein INR64_15380, partial [Caulobacteraceae bacterium]|nr:hypothetical protein [Caulobacter sp.]